MADGRLHFFYHPEAEKPEIEAFANQLMAAQGQTPVEDADIIVAIGGDGILLRAFQRAAKGQKVFGVVPPGSASKGFWTNHGIESVSELFNAVARARSYKLHPLRADIVYKDGSTGTIHAYNEINPFKDTAQAVLVDMTVQGENSTIGPIRIMGDGLIFARGLGSTGINHSYLGPDMDIRNSGVILTGQGINDPFGGFRPIIADDDMKFDLKFLQAEKRPTQLFYDSFYVPLKPENPIISMHIERDLQREVELMVVDDPSTRAFAMMKPAARP